MATIDLTLDNLLVPAIEGYTPPFGTKITKTSVNKGGLSTVEVNSNIMMPFANMRPKVITENSSTTEIEYDAKLCFSASLLAGATLVLDDGAYEGCRVQITNLSSYTCTVEYNSATLVSIPTGANIEVLWTGSSWMLSTTGTIASGNVMPPSSSAVHAAIDDKFTDNITNVDDDTWYTNVSSTTSHYTSHFLGKYANWETSNHLEYTNNNNYNVKVRVWITTLSSSSDIDMGMIATVSDSNGDLIIVGSARYCTMSEVIVPPNSTLKVAPIDLHAGSNKAKFAYSVYK